MKLFQFVLVPISRSDCTTGLAESKSEGNAPPPDSGVRTEVESFRGERKDGVPYKEQQIKNKNQK